MVIDVQINLLYEIKLTVIFSQWLYFNDESSELKTHEVNIDYERERAMLPIYIFHNKSSMPSLNHGHPC